MNNRHIKRLRVHGRRKADLRLFLKIGSSQATFAQQLSKAAAPLSSCSKGCNACCHRAVTATLVEACNLLVESLKQGCYLTLRKRVAEYVERFKYVDRGDFEEAWWQSQEPCPVLDPYNGSCAVYNVRPMACTGHWVSSDPSLCEYRALGPQTVRRLDTKFVVGEFLGIIVTQLQRWRVPQVMTFAYLPFALHWAQLWLRLHPKEWVKVTKTDLYLRHGFTEADVFLKDVQDEQKPI